MNDGDLVRAIQQGDRASLTIFYRRYLGGIWRYVHAHLPRDPAAADDVVSETFLAAIQSIPTYDAEKGNVIGWLLGIARNKLRDHLRSSVRKAESPPIEPTTAVRCQAGMAEANLIRAETREAVLRALDALADEERLVLEWKYVESLSVREIAARLARTEKAVEAILYRARMSFRAACGREQIKS
jgi:RNA polymerase sigma-70 factor (ECF subfamily)